MVKYLSSLLLLTVCLGICFAQNSGPVGKFTLEYYSLCEGFEYNDAYKHKAFLNKKDDGPSVFDIEFSLKEDIDEEMEFRLDVDKFNNGVWEKDFYSNGGPLFTNVKQYMPAVYDHAKALMDPPIEEEKLIKAGDYHLKEFSDVEGSLSVPSIFYGKFKAFMYLIKDDVEVFCAEFGADSQAG